MSSTVKSEIQWRRQIVREAEGKQEEFDSFEEEKF